MYDWDEFGKIVPCSSGKHTDVDAAAKEQGQDEFFKSSTVANAQKALEKEQNKEIKKISDFNKEQEKIEEEKRAQQLEKKVFVTPTGKFKCINKGCQKEYSPAENNEQACNYHPGMPIFHDIKKFWSCCKVTPRASEIELPSDYGFPPSRKHIGASARTAHLKN